MKKSLFLLALALALPLTAQAGHRVMVCEEITRTT
jgi:hypothetical protein